LFVPTFGLADHESDRISDGGYRRLLSVEVRRESGEGKSTGEHVNAEAGWGSVFDDDRCIAKCLRRGEALGFGEPGEGASGRQYAGFRATGRWERLPVQLGQRSVTSR